MDFRGFEPEDYPRFVDVYNYNYPESPTSVPGERSFDENVDSSKYLLRRFVAMDSDRKVLGFGQIRHDLAMFHPRKFNIAIFVDPVEQGKGVGRAIYQRLAEELKGLDAIVAWAWTREDSQRQRDFFLRRGFHEANRTWDSRLEVESVDLSRFQSYLDHVAEQGITFTTLRDELQQGSDLKGLHELVQLIVGDMPMEAAFTPISFEQWHALVFNNTGLLPDGYLIAKHGEECVGVSIVNRSELDSRGLSTDDTGVRREYRGKGIATALKLKVIEFAQSNGYEWIKTRNDSTNSAMLAINTKLGFKRQTGRILMKRELGT